MDWEEQLKNPCFNYVSALIEKELTILCKRMFGGLTKGMDHGKRVGQELSVDDLKQDALLAIWEAIKNKNNWLKIARAAINNTLRGSIRAQSTLERYKALRHKKNVW